MDSKNGITIGRKGNTYKLIWGNKVDNSRAKWDSIYNIDDLINMLKFMVNNTFIQLMGYIYKQAVGIPMGNNSGVNIVDFYLVSYELKFMKQLVILAKWDLLQAFLHTLRYLDDLLSINNALFSQLLYTDNVHEGIKGIYPRKAVTLQLVDKGLDVHYMDSHILRFPTQQQHFLSNKLFTKTYDKRTSKKWRDLRIIKYPSAQSLINHDIGYNIMITQCHRFSIMDMRKEDFIADIIKVFHDLALKGFDKVILLSKVRRFILTWKQTALYGKQPFKIYMEIEKIVNLQSNKYWTTTLQRKRLKLKHTNVTF